VKSNIELNGVPVIWVSVDEDPATGELVTFAATNEYTRDDLVLEALVDLNRQLFKKEDSE
tara:strand:- start:122 stop:301 length:180 start_codon:yes stop_codon:yes gene_type:complete